MFTVGMDDESTALVKYLDLQLDAIRAAPVGLTEDQARSTPCRSALSVGGTIKHIVYVMRGAISTLGSPEPPVLDAAAYAVHQASFSLTDDETTADVLRAFDEVRPEYLAALAAADPPAQRSAPPEPWRGRSEPAPMTTRHVLDHQLEELARHAGHLDILREQIDGVAVPQVAMTRAGVAANAFFQPYQPAPGTIDS